MTERVQFALRRIAGAAIVRISLAMFALLISAGRAASGQALPAAEAAPISTGFSVPHVAGSLQYGISASESLYWGYYQPQGAESSTNLTGDLAFISNSKRDPFSMVFAGGRSWSTSGQPSYGFVNLGLSQVVDVGRWSLVGSDSISYLPGTATTGLSGVAGVGDLGVTPVQVGADTGQGVLTNYSTRVNNTSSGSIQRALTGRTSLNGFASYGILRFVGSGVDAGLESNSVSGGGGLSHQFDARNSLGGNFAYSSYTFVGATYGVAAPSFTSQTASGFYTHQFTRKIGISLSAGPQWTNVESTTSLRSVSVYVDASATYAGRFSHASIAYVRGTNNGFGVAGGSLSNSVTFTTSKTFAVVWNCSVYTAYSRTSGLATTGVNPASFDTFVGGGQVSRAIMRNLSGYASYTLEHQSNSNTAAAVDAFSGLSQVVGFGLTYSPTSIHLGRQ